MSPSPYTLDTLKSTLGAPVIPGHWTHLCICSHCSPLRRTLPAAYLRARSNSQICFLWTSLYFSFKFEPIFKHLENATWEYGFQYLLDKTIFFLKKEGSNIISAVFQVFHQPLVSPTAIFFRWGLHLNMSLCLALSRMKVSQKWYEGTKTQTSSSWAYYVTGEHRV